MKEAGEEFQEKKNKKTKKITPKSGVLLSVVEKYHFLEGILKVILNQFRLSLCLTFAFWDKDDSRLTAVASRLEQQQQYSKAHFNRFKDLKKKGMRGGCAWPGLWGRHEGTEVCGTSDGSLAAAVGPLETSQWDLMTALTKKKKGVKHVRNLVLKSSAGTSTVEGNKTRNRVHR